MSQNKSTIVIAEFGNSGALLHAAERVRDDGAYKGVFDCHSPFPIHGMDAAMGLRRSPLGWLTGILGFSAVLGMVAFIWWVSVVAYPLTISGKPLFSYQAYFPPVFAVGVLTGALTAAVGMILLNRLPRLYHPLFFSEKFSRVTDDGFFISIEGKSDNFDAARAQSFLTSIGGTNVEVITEE